MKLSKALRLKNRIAGEVRVLQNRIRRHNSHDARNTPVWDVVELKREMEAKVETLTKLKVAISTANGPILERIHKMEEIKGLLSFWEDVDTKQGLVFREYGDAEPRTFEATFTEKDIATFVAALKEELEDLQDDLAAHNIATNVDMTIQ